MAAHPLRGVVAVVLGASGYVGRGAVHAFLTQVLLLDAHVVHMRMSRRMHAAQVDRSWMLLLHALCLRTCTLLHTLLHMHTCRAWRAQGATVVAVSRAQDKLDTLRKDLEHLLGEEAKALHTVVADWNTDAAAAAALAAVKRVVGGRPLDHVVSSLGFVTALAGGPTKHTAAELAGALDGEFFPLFRSAAVFLPELKVALRALCVWPHGRSLHSHRVPNQDREGSSFSLVSGGFAHGAYVLDLWSATVKNAAINALVSHERATQWL